MTSPMRSSGNALTARLEAGNGLLPHPAAAKVSRSAPRAARQPMEDGYASPSAANIPSEDKAAANHAYVPRRLNRQTKCCQRSSAPTHRRPYAAIGGESRLKSQGEIWPGASGGGSGSGRSRHGDGNVWRGIFARPQQPAAKAQLLYFGLHSLCL
jgi:hypothetical protein